MISSAAARFLRFMNEEFWLFLLLSIGAAFLFPDFGREVLKPLALPAILAQMYVVMLNIEPGQLVRAFRAWRPLARALFFIFAATPLTVYAMRGFFPPELVLGLAVVAAMPSGMGSAFFAMQYGGDAALAVIVTAISHLLVPVVAPVLVKLVAGSALTVDPAVIFIRLAQLVLLPFVAAWLTRRMLGAARTAALYTRIGWMGGFFIIIVTWGLVADVTVVSIPLLPIASGVLAANGLLFALGHFLGGREAKTMSMVAGYRNVTLGMVLAMSVWNDPLVALPSIVWTLTHTLYAVALLFLYRRSLKKQR